MVLIASCYFQQNYGSMLQAYATQAFLDELHIENRTINYSQIASYIKKRKILFYIAHVYIIDTFVSQLHQYSFKCRQKMDKRLKQDIFLRKQVMKKFENTRFRLTTPYSFKYLSKLCTDMNANAVLLGSDQLWLPSNIYANYYTLNFVPSNIKKISYSTSFGVSQLDKKTKKRAKSFLGNFNFISVREKSGQKLVSEITGDSPQIVCDPTMLISAEKWRVLLKTKNLVKNPYILCYFLGNNPWQREWAKQLKKTTGLQIISLIHLDSYIKCDNSYYDQALFDIGPSEFVSLIENAEFVCTDSFHGTVFSLLFHKRFFSFRRFRENYYSSTNSRLDSLLTLLGLADHIVEQGVTPCEMLKKVINYDDVDKQLGIFRSDSISWLKNALGVNQDA